MYIAINLMETHCHIQPFYLARVQDTAVSRAFHKVSLEMFLVRMSCVRALTGETDISYPSDYCRLASAANQEQRRREADNSALLSKYPIVLWVISLCGGTSGLG